MIYTSEVLNLVCGLKQNTDLTSDCYKHVLSALHVTLADIMREEVRVLKLSYLSQFYTEIYATKMWTS